MPHEFFTMKMRIICVKIVLILSFALSCDSGETEDNSEDKSTCESDDEDCFFKRYSKLKLPSIDPVKVGYVRNVELEPSRTYDMKTLAMRPPLFEIPNFLSAAECDHIITLATKQGLEMSSTVQDNIATDINNLGQNTEEEFKEWDRDKNQLIDLNEIHKGFEVFVDFTPEKQTVLKLMSATNLDQDGDGNVNLKEFLQRNTTSIALFIRQIKEEQPHTKSRHSQQTWLTDTKATDPVMRTIQKRVQRLTRLPMELVQASEYLQVVTYGQKGHYNCHLDSDFPTPQLDCCHLLETDTSNCRICRYITVLYFLNDVEDGGETAFPLADNSTFDETTWMRDDQGLCNLAKNCNNSNVVAKPSKGKAIMWYSHLVDEKTGWMGALDHFSFHGGCDVRKGRKWIANNWISVSNDRISDLWNWIGLAQSKKEDSQGKKTDKIKEEL